MGGGGGEGLKLRGHVLYLPYRGKGNLKRAIRLVFLYLVYHFVCANMLGDELSLSDVMRVKPLELVN